MTFEELIAKIDDAYPDGMLGRYAAEPDGFHGDSLAKLLVGELQEAFDPAASDAEQLRAARRAVEGARREMAEVVDRLAGLELLASAQAPQAPAEEMLGEAPPAEHWKCAECRIPYPVDLPACPGCGAAERTRCQAQGCDEIECGDLATGVFHERGHTFDGCDEHRERPY